MSIYLLFSVFNVPNSPLLRIHRPEIFSVDIDLVLAGIIGSGMKGQSLLLDGDGVWKTF